MLLPYPSLRQGLIGCWVPSLGASGLLLIDRSGRNNHATLTNMGGQNNWRASGSGVALSFDGTNDYALGATSSGFPLGSSARTLSVWFKMGSNVNSEFLSYGGNFTSGCRFALYRDSGGVGVEISNSGRSSPWAFDTSWHHLAATHDASASNVTACRVFLDGLLVATTPFSPGITLNTQQTPVTIGAISGAPSVYLMNGQLDDARIYSRALAPAEIALLASQRGIGLRYGQHFDDDSDLQQYPIATPPNRVHANVAGVWVPGQVRANTAGTWGNGETRVNQGGEWL